MVPDHAGAAPGIRGAVMHAGSASHGALKILLHYPVLNTGGAEHSTLRLMSALVERGCEVHLVLTVGGGSLEPRIDPRVAVHHLRDGIGDLPTRVTGFSDAIRFVRAALGWLRGRVQQAWRSRRFHAMAFDAAIVGLHGTSPAFVCRHVRARRRFVMVRSDAADDPRGRLRANVSGFSSAIDAYVCVSGAAQDSLVAHFPELVAKSVRIYNLLQPERMRAQAADAPDPFILAGDRQGPRVLSVCRLQESQKALLRMVDVHRRLLSDGIAHTWHVLGDGPDRGLLEQAIAAHGVAGSFTLHGSVSNPFPWYVHADLVAVLSRYEGLCGVVNEARVLERPVIATRFAGIDEQIESGVNGLIVAQDTDAIVAGMRRLLGDAALRSRLAAGGYPDALMDDGAKIDALLAVMAPPPASSGVDS